MRRLRATVRDIAAYGTGRVQLEIMFKKEDADALPGTHRGLVELVIRSNAYEGTIGIKPPNAPYLHSPLFGPRGRTNCTEVLGGLGCTHGDALVFEVASPRKKLGLKRVLKGEGPSPRAGPRVRKSTQRKSVPHARPTPVRRQAQARAR